MPPLVARLNDLKLEELLKTDEGWLAIAFVVPQLECCRYFRPEFEKYAGRAQTVVRCCTIDATEHPSISEILNVHMVPTTIVWKGGVEKARYCGPYSMMALEERISVVISKNKGTR